MAISWLTVLRNVPWTDVISNAPRVADGAKKLWSTVARDRETHDFTPPPAADVRPVDAAAVAALRTRVAQLEEEVEELQGQMLASSALIKDLADQNTQLVAGIDGLRKRAGWLAGATAFAALLALAALMLALVQRAA